MMFIIIRINNDGNNNNDNSNDINNSNNIDDNNNNSNDDKRGTSPSRSLIEYPSIEYPIYIYIHPIPMNIVPYTH